MTTFAPDTPAFMLSDWVEEHARDYGVKAERNADGELIITVHAKGDGLPDWETFLRVAKELQGADGWVMEGAEPLTFGWLTQIDDAGYPLYGGRWSANTVPRFLMHVKYSNLYGYKGNSSKKQLISDLSRACVEYSRSGGVK